MRDWEFKEWLIVVAAVLVALLLLFAVLKSAEASPTAAAGCQQTKYPAICETSYAKCNTIGLDDACLAVAKLDGQLGYDSANGNQIPTSQNVPDTELPQFSGDKPVERVHN